MKLTMSHIFKISGLQRNRSYELLVIPDGKGYKKETFPLIANEEAERTFLKVLLKKSDKAESEFELEQGSPAVGVGILAALVGGFVYYKRQR